MLRPLTDTELKAHWAKHDAIVLDAVARSANDFAAGASRCADARRLAGLPKEHFDFAALRLQAAGKLMLYHHDAAGLLPEAERAEFVRDGTVYFNLMKVRT